MKRNIDCSLRRGRFFILSSGFVIARESETVRLIINRLDSFALRLRMTWRWLWAPTAAQSASVTSDSHLYITPGLSRSLKTVRLERPSLRHSGLRSGIYSFLSLRRNSGVNNNCWRGKLQRPVLSERSEFTSLDAEPCRLLVRTDAWRLVL